MATEDLSDHPLHSIARDSISVPTRDTDPNARLLQSHKNTKLEALTPP